MIDVKNKAIWLRGYLESLSASETISQKQIQILIEKIEELISYMEENKNNDINDGGISTPHNYDLDNDEDLPF